MRALAGRLLDHAFDLLPSLILLALVWTPPRMSFDFTT